MDWSLYKSINENSRFIDSLLCGSHGQFWWFHSKLCWARSAWSVPIPCHSAALQEVIGLRGINIIKTYLASIYLPFLFLSTFTLLNYMTLTSLPVKSVFLDLTAFVIAAQCSVVWRQHNLTVLVLIDIKDYFYFTPCRCCYNRTREHYQRQNSL